MEKTLELDDLKSAWKQLDRRLERLEAHQETLSARHRLQRARSRLEVLQRSLVAQISLGGAFALLGGTFWIEHRERPSLLLAGLLVHLYGIALIGLGARTLTLIAAIDYAAPVVAIQMRLAKLRAFHVRNSIVGGMSWCLLWIPLAMMLFSAFSGVDLYRHSPAFVWLGSAAGVAGLAFCAWLYRRARRPGRPALAHFIDQSLAGASLRRAEAAIAAISRFDREH